MIEPQTRQRPAGTGREVASKTPHAHSIAAPHGRTIDALLARLEGVQPSGTGHRARCPACGGKSRKLSITEAESGATLIHCFGGCSAAEVLAAIGLSLADLFPARIKPRTPEERRAAQRAARMAQWGAAIEMLALESSVVHLAAYDVLQGRTLDMEDRERLATAVERIQNARDTLRDPPRWRPEVN